MAKQDRRNGIVTVNLNSTFIPVTGDGLLFTDPAKGREDWGFSLNNTPVVKDKRTLTFSVPRPVAPGSALYITSSRDLETRARQIIAHPPADLVHKIPVDLSIMVDTEGQISIDGRLESGSGKEVRVSYPADFCLVPARSRPLTRDQLEVQIRKSGDTPFIVRDCSIAYDGTLFAPVSELNRLRRDFLARAEAALLASSIPSYEDIARSRQRLDVAFPEHAFRTFHWQ